MQVGNVEFELDSAGFLFRIGFLVLGGPGGSWAAVLGRLNTTDIVVWRGSMLLQASQSD